MKHTILIVAFTFLCTSVMHTMDDDHNNSSHVDAANVTTVPLNAYYLAHHNIRESRVHLYRQLESMPRITSNNNNHHPLTLEPSTKPTGLLEPLLRDEEGPDPAPKKHSLSPFIARYICCCTQSKTVYPKKSS